MNKLKQYRKHYDPSPDLDPELGLSFLLKPFYFILIMWFVFWLDQRLMLGLAQFGILPRHVEGLIGVVASPLLHGSLEHISNNTIPLLALGAGLFYFYPRIALVVISISWLSSGFAVWLIGRESYHIGASGLIYALAGFIFLSGLLRRQPNLLALSLLVVFVYGSLVWGIFPLQESVSWEAHLTGAAAGFALAIHFRKFGPRRKKYSWDMETEVGEEQFIAEDTNFTDTAPLETQKEIWEDYANSSHGIRYTFKPGKKGEDNNPKQ